MTEVRAKKALGQHFLTDLNIAQKICNSLTERTEGEPEAVLEVGCGMGVLTQYLLRREDIITYGAEIDSESVEYLNAHYPETGNGILGIILQHIVGMRNLPLRIPQSRRPHAGDHGLVQRRKGREVVKPHHKGGDRFISSHKGKPDLIPRLYQLPLGVK